MKSNKLPHIQEPNSIIEAIMQNHFSGIREFLTAVETGSFSAAGDQLGLTGSAVEKSIYCLENRLQTQLFHRSTRKITLTREGEMYLASCKRIMDELEQAGLLLSNEQQKVIGEVRIDLPTTYGRRFLLPKLLNLQSRYPKLRLNVSFQDRKTDMIAEQIDLTVRFGTLGDLPDIIAKPISSSQNLLCAAPSYFAEHDTPQHPDELRFHRCIIGNRPEWLLKNEQGKPQAYPLNVQHALNDGDALLQAALIGGCIIFAPNWLVEEEIIKGNLVAILPNFCPEPEPISVLWQRKQHLQPKIRAVVEALAE